MKNWLPLQRFSLLSLLKRNKLYVLLVTIFFSTALQAQIINTVAGNGSYAFSGDGGQATSAALSSPFGLVTDGAGNIYIADTFNNRIRKINATTGIITTIAGSGSAVAGSGSATVTYSGDGGLAVNAGLNFPRSVALDGEGNLYIADTDNHCIRKVTAATGIISTIAGTGAAGFSGDNGQAASATLSSPRMVLVDGAKNVYIVDTGNQRIRLITAATGIISTIVGDGTAAYSGDGGPAINASLNSPSGIALDGKGNLYIGDYLNHCIRKVAPAGTITTIAGTGTAGFSGDGGLATNANLNTPYGVVVDRANNIYIADQNNNRIRLITSTGIITTVAGTGTGGFSGDGELPTKASLSFPFSVAVDSKGALYIADYFNHRIRKVTFPTATVAATAAISTLAGTAAPSSGVVTLAAPSAVAVRPDGGVYIADQNNNQVRLVPPSGAVATVAGTGAAGFSGNSGPATSAMLARPSGVAVDGAGNLYIADQDNNQVRVVAPSGAIATVAGTGAAGFSGDGGQAASAALARPSGVAVDGAGNLYIADQDNNRVRVVAPSGVITTVAGTGAAGFSGDGGQAASAALARPSGVAVDEAGNLYIADQDNNRVRVVAPSGVITTVAGTGTAGFSGDGGVATSAALARPSGVAVDGAGNLYIADQDNNRVRVVAPSGAIATMAGTGATGFSGDGGLAASATLAKPSGVAVDGAGKVYIADQDNNQVRVVNNPPTITGFHANPGTVCVGASITLVATIGNYNGAYSYSLTDGNTLVESVATSSSYSQALSLTMSGQQVYTLTVGTASGSTSKTIAITVNQVPSIPAILNTGAQLTALVGNSISLSATCSLGQVEFSNSNSFASLTITSPLTVSSSQGTTLYYVRCNNNGCTSSIVSVSFTAYIYTPVIMSINPGSGAVGSVFTLTGINLNNFTSLKINGTPVTTIYFSSSTTIQAVVPAGASSGLVSLTANGLASNTVSFSVVAPLIPSSFVATDMLTCPQPGQTQPTAGLAAMAIGTEFIFTGPNGYVFSNTYRQSGIYNVFANDISQPGTYTLTIFNNGVQAGVYTQAISSSCTAGKVTMTKATSVLPALRVMLGPNPMTDETVSVTVEGATNLVLRLQLYNSLGVLADEQLIDRAGESEQILMKFGHQRGSYILKVIVPDGEKSIWIAR